MTARIVVACTVALALSAAAFILLGRAAPADLPYTSETRIAEGRALYAEHCAACHGAGLEGEPDWQTRDAEGYLPAPPLDDSGHAWHHADVLLVDLVERGPEALLGGGYKSRMPGFAGEMTEAEILSTLAYVKSTWPLLIVEAHNWVNGKPSGAPVSLDDLEACGLSLSLASGKAKDG